MWLNLIWHSVTLLLLLPLAIPNKRLVGKIFAWVVVSLAHKIDNITDNKRNPINSKGREDFPPLIYIPRDLSVHGLASADELIVMS